MFGNFLIMCAIGIGIHLFNILVSNIIFNKKTVKDDSERIVLQYSSIYSNCGFMGFPLLESLVKTNGLFYGSAFNIIFGFFTWTHGFLLYSGKLDKKSVIKAVLNPNVFAAIIGTLFYCLSITLPSPIHMSVQYIAQLNTPLSMIIIGTTMTQISFAKIFTNIRVWMGVAVRNLFLPLAIFFILYLIGIRGELLLCSVIVSACPVAGLAVLFAKLTNKDVAFPCKVLTLSTLLSLVTLPIVLCIVRAFGI